jgi:hypothetical protein
MNEVPAEERLWNLMRGAMVVQALRVAAELGVADELAAGARPVDEVARAVGADADSLNRFLRALAAEGVFAEEEPGAYRNTETSELLRTGRDWNAFAHFFGGVWYAAFAESLHAARTGDETFSRTTGEGWWEWLAARPAEGELFNRAMSGGADRVAERLAELAWDAETVVDVGGGNGAILIELLRRKPQLHGVVFDLPEVAREAEARVTSAGLADRCAVAAGSMFDGVPPDGDAYVLSGVLHDWDDAAAATILRNVHSVAPAHARVLVLESVLAPGTGQPGAKWLDLLMLVLNRGRERTEPEWRSLLAATGFTPTRVDDGLVEARPT